MLQELDQVAVRVGQVVEMSRRLLAERNSLLERLTASESACTELQEQLADSQARVVELSANLEEQTETIQTENESLRTQVQTLNEKVLALETALTQAKTDIENWRGTAQAVRHRVAHVLENLPGTVTEQGEE